MLLSGPLPVGSRPVSMPRIQLTAGVSEHHLNQLLERFFIYLFFLNGKRAMRVTGVVDDDELS